MQSRIKQIYVALALIAPIPSTYELAHAADTPSPRQQCLLGELEVATPDRTVDDLRKHCSEEPTAPSPEQETPANPNASLVGARLSREEAAEANRSTLIPHRRNYFMPFTYMEHPNEQPFQQAGVETPHQNLDNGEMKFQLSLKVSLLHSLLADNDQLYFAFTMLSFWQAFNSGLSSPFRETNYEPEFIYLTPLPATIFESDATFLALGFAHQSNGRATPLSRGWNRLYANLIWERSNFVFSFKPWWRIPEAPRRDPQSSRGDDNPDISKYLGYFEFSAAYRLADHEISAMFRNNLRAKNRAAAQLEWTFPLYRRLRGYVEYFNGYGESLIDYNVHMQRVGVGFMLSDLL